MTRGRFVLRTFRMSKISLFDVSISSYLISARNEGGLKSFLYNLP